MPPSTSSSHLFFLSDRTTHTRFLVDTGSEVSVIPPSRTDQNSSDTLTLTAVNNTPISTFGKRSLTLNLGLRRSLPWIFIIADVRNPIISADFLRHFALLVDMQNRKLIDTHNCASRAFSLRCSLLVRPFALKTLVTHM